MPDHRPPTLADIQHTFSTLNRQQLLRFTLRWAHNLTIAFRDTYDHPPEAAAARGRNINERQHRIIAAAMTLAEDSPDTAQVVEFLLASAQTTLECGDSVEQWALTEAIRRINPPIGTAGDADSYPCH